jgi:outer membrane lipoprotein carrier protein
MSFFLAAMMTLLPAFQADPVEIAKRVQDKYEQAKTVQSDFRQIYRSASTGKVTEESGKLTIKSPAKMRWDYLDPEKKLYVSDGQTVYWYIPADRQATRMSLQDADRQQTQILFLMGEGDIVRDFDIRLALDDLNEREQLVLNGYPYNRLKKGLPNYEGSFFLRLVPKREEDYEYLIMVVNPKDSYVERLVIFDSLGNSTDYLFTDISHPFVEDGYFFFEVPKGVEVFEGK